MKLDKLKISPLTKNGARKETISVLFNPTSYSIEKTVRWDPLRTSCKEDAQTVRELNAPPLTFGGGDTRRLTLELFFDVTERAEQTGQTVDVRAETDRIVKLTRIDRSLKPPSPPVCEVFWGGPSQDFPFIGVITSLTQRFTLFKSSGVPLRAILTVGFKEFQGLKEDKLKTDPEFTTRVVKRGDSLSSIAAEVYNNSALWRVIAETNNLDDPRRLEIGMTLSIPKIG